MVLQALRSAVRSRRFAWLLALALWLPAAQWAAATHALLHLHDSVVVDHEAGGDPAAHLPGNCDLCIVAAALGSGAAATEGLQAFAQTVPAARPAWHAVAAPAGPPALPYRSRAPPVSC